MTNPNVPTAPPASAFRPTPLEVAVPIDEVNAELAAQINGLRAQLAQQPSPVPSGVLAWFGPTDFPNGAEGSPAISQQEWERYYLRLQFAALEPQLLPSLYTLQATTNAFRADGPLPIAIANIALSVPTAEFAERVRKAAAAGQPLDPPPGPLPTVIEESRAFMVAGLMHDQWGQATPVFRSRVVTLVLDERFYCTNPGGPLPDQIEIDAQDGRGWRRAQFGVPLTVVYATWGTHTVTVRCRYGDTVLYGSMSVTLQDLPVAPFPDETWSLTGYPSFNTGSAYVYRAPGHAQVVNPVIIAEGFPGGFPYDYLYDLVNQAGTLERMRAAGYDVILVSFANGTDIIQNNAQVFIACMEQVVGLTPNPMVVGGVSMGGLVARYALLWLQARGLPTNTRLYLSVDSPHGGAYTNLADQWFAHFFSGASVEAQAISGLLDAPSNQQFLMTWVSQGASGPSPLRTAFLAELKSLGGYPQGVRRIAVSCGTGDGKATGPTRQRMLTWVGSPFAWSRLWTLPGQGEPAMTVGEGYCFLQPTPPEPAALSVASSVSWEVAPGGQNLYNWAAADIAVGIGCAAQYVQDLVPKTCSVPTVSALDLGDWPPFEPVPPPESGKSPFDDYICSDQNELHLTITPKVSDWLLAQLGAPVVAPAPAPQPTPVTTPAAPVAPQWDPNSFNPHAPDFLANPYPTYARFREQAPIHWVDSYKSYWIFRYEDAKTVLEAKDIFIHNVPKDPPPPPTPLFGVLENMPVGLFSMDPPRHDEVRPLMNVVFGESIVGADAIAEVFARPLLVAAKASRRVELIGAYAAPLPLQVLMTVMGVPMRDWAGMAGWVGMIAASNDPTQPLSVLVGGGTSVMATGAYYQSLMQPKIQSRPSRCPIHARAGGIVDRMMNEAMGAAPKMSPEEVQATATNLTVAGYLSTTFLIGTGTLNLLNNPDQLELLRRNPELRHSAVEEMLRYDAPAQLAQRTANQDFQLGNTLIRKGDTVMVVLGSANRDASVFPNPDTFDITRTPNPHVGFGDGIHYCIGAPLVRMVAPAAFLMLIQELATMKLDGIPQWGSDPFLRSVSNLPLAIG
jgi:cytochrome P450